MKKLLTALFVALLMVGCASEDDATPSDPVDSSTTPEVADSPKAIDLNDPETLDEIIAEAINYKKLQFRGAISYAPNQQTPYTGWVK